MTTKSTEDRQPVTAAAQATADAAAQLTLEALAAGLDRLASTPPVERARLAKVYQVAAQRLMAEAHREAIYEATRGRKYEDVGAELGVSKAAINLAVTQYRREHPAQG